MVGAGSPTALQGSTMSLIQGVVTVRLKVRIRAGAAPNKTAHNVVRAGGHVVHRSKVICELKLCKLVCFFLF